ncbi:cobalt-zinc-cadmium resistance protein CzcA [Singulisphaera sp. GP187]|uniref:efflux RND transporter permease subunit n=1 Tax=Singulisphaera sp. GP187 TaxID=1882752 RepID=UPI00092A15DE|nr:efflux RND transporter permease subunit [Singulisphaera sp. GP187]SIN68564.1 cobalt-zinc-cadmium resistance protein CzcA [Singulisphaera sp. GP187]
MVRKLIAWAVNNPLVALLIAVALAAFGSYAFAHINVEAYPDPAPAILEVVAQYPGASAEEVERLVTIPLEVSLSGMTGLQSMRSKSLFGLAFLNCQFAYGTDYLAARQEVLNRMQMADLPAGVLPSISPRSPIGEIFRYTLSNPKDAFGAPIYSLHDLKTLQNWTLVREFRRLPGVVDVVSFGGDVKRYEVHPDPERMKRYGITLKQLQESIAASNANVGGDYLVQGDTVQVVRGLGLIGQGQDPALAALAMTDPLMARDRLRAEERRRILEVRQIVIASTNNVPVRVEDVIDGGPVPTWEEVGEHGVVVGRETRLGRVILSRPTRNDQGEEVESTDGSRAWVDEDDAVQGLVMLRKGADTLPTLQAVAAKIKELNENPGRLLPGVKVVAYYDRNELINVTTETVKENLFLGMALVTVVLLMFLGHVRSALIIAINLPLALLFAFSVLFLRGKSANLLSIGAVDFGIIVDSTVIIVENTYRHLSSGENRDRSLGERIIRASWEVERGLFFSTVIMVCAMLPLFTMTGPEGQIFGPMADTYAFALAGALFLALTVSPVLCLFLFRNLKQKRENVLVRSIRDFYVWQLERILRHRWLALAVFAALTAFTIGVVVPQLGREFMPELDEGHIWVRGIFPVHVSLDEVTHKSEIARRIMREFPEVQLVAAQLGRPDGGTDPTSFYSAEYFVPLRHQDQWPEVETEDGRRKRTKSEVIEAMNEELSRTLVGVNWNFSQQIRDNVLEVLSGVQGENSVKIVGPDLDELERVARRVETALDGVRGIRDVGMYRIMGQSNLEFAIDRAKCSTWNIRVSDVEEVIQTAIGGKPFTRMIEGEKAYDITLRWPEPLRSSEEAILDIPIDVTGHNVTEGPVATLPGTPFTGSSVGISSMGSNVPLPASTGSRTSGALIDLGTTPRRRLRELVSPMGKDQAGKGFVRPGATTIFREQGSRVIAVKFSVRGRDLASSVAEAQAKVAPLIKAPYRTEWSGEFRQMEQAERRMVLIIALALALILVLLYLAFGSLLDAVVIFANVAAVSLGGIWSLWLTGTHFNISAAVGFISVLGVAVMNGLLLVSSFNGMRSQGVPLHEALVQGLSRRVRPLMITALTAILGLLPAALSTKMGSQAQQPLAIVVVGGMVMTLILMNLLPLLYSFYGHREPPTDSANLGH